VIEYVAGSRGFYQKIIIEKKMARVSSERAGKDKIVPMKISNSDWKELVSFFKMIELDSLAKLKAPTENVFMTVRPLQV
jgi:hypothetical protein